ncbi:hypothetical protein BGX26_001185 [Mortierella sp. AD094]|nr:hypothetical protein BGX26_001185 [Mortierella sp. AD094]
MSTQNIDHNIMAGEKHAHEPINIPTVTSTSSAGPIVSPSKSRGNKTGTRSTFCPNSQIRMSSTKLTEADFEDPQPPQPKGILEFLGLKKPDNYGGVVEETPNEGSMQPYY